MYRDKIFRKILFWSCLFSALTACTDDDDFSISPANVLSFSRDTITMDTVFSRVPTATQTFWVYNRHNSGLRCTSVRLDRGNQTGFRVNVDGMELGRSQGFKIGEVESPKKDSIRVFVELTSSATYQDEPKKIEDDIVFVLESGVEQRVNLNAWTWDADQLSDLVISNDTVITTNKPIIIYGGITVKEGATLTIGAGTTLYFHDKAGIDVYGRLICTGTAEKNVTLRGDRIDKMFDYLPYDGVSGQWAGLHFYGSSYENSINFTDIHSACDGIVCDSSDVSRMKLTLANSIIHNSQGYGLKAVHSAISIENCQITNALNDCVGIFGGIARINQSTIAQFYPFDSNRGSALRFTNYFEDADLPLYGFECINSIVTGYADDVVMGQTRDTTIAYTYQFDHCLLRTPEMDADSARLKNIIWENPEDTTTAGHKNFQRVDIELLRYDFRLTAESPAVGAANKNFSTKTDRLGITRDDLPDMGCYEFIATTEDEKATIKSRNKQSHNNHR